uniref:Uncharacterized protein n=1 Tax=Anopheles quadriannulatus TaxID=34691 RepID=A0A182XTH4_ANOQN
MYGDRGCPESCSRIWEPLTACSEKTQRNK